MGLLVIVALKIQPKPITKFYSCIRPELRSIQWTSRSVPTYKQWLFFFFFFNYRDLFEIKDRVKQITTKDLVTKVVCLK